MADKKVDVSVTDKTFTSEVGIHSTPVSQIVESSATESVELNTIQVTPISTRHENKKEDNSDIINMMKFLMKEQNNNLKAKFDEVNSRFDVSVIKMNDKCEMQNNETKLMLSLIHI